MSITMYIRMPWCTEALYPLQKEIASFARLSTPVPANGTEQHDLEKGPAVPYFKHNQSDAVRNAAQACNHRPPASGGVEHTDPLWFILQ